MGRIPYIVMALGEPEKMELTIASYLSGLDSRIFELKKNARPPDQEIEEIGARIKRANKPFIDGNVDEQGYAELVSPLREKLDTMEAKRGAHKPTVD